MDIHHQPPKEFFIMEASQVPPNCVLEPIEMPTSKLAVPETVVEKVAAELDGEESMFSSIRQGMRSKY
jgi:hypothetical protein